MTPGELHSRFFEYLQANNQPQLADCQAWVFQPGMAFQSLTQWWGRQKPRPAPHEGIDLGCFEDRRGGLNWVQPPLKIPATFAGAVVKIAGDFLGQSVFLSHEIYDHLGRRLLTIYGHTQPVPGLAAGRAVAEGEIIAELARPPGNHKIPPHLHLTFAWVPVPGSPAQLDWGTLGTDPDITLLDPLLIL